jgi:hypothetical protein
MGDDNRHQAAGRLQLSLARAIKYLAERLNPANPEGEYARAFDIIIKGWGVDGALGMGGTDQRTGEDVKISPAKLEHLDPDFQISTSPDKIFTITNNLCRGPTLAYRDACVDWFQFERLVQEIAPVPIPVPAEGSETAHKEETAHAGTATSDAASATDTEASAPAAEAASKSGASPPGAQSDESEAPPQDMPGVELEAPQLGKQLDRSTVGGAEAPQKPKLQLTYAEFGKRIGRSPDAVRTLVARRRLPRTIGSGGKALVTISQGILDQLQSDQSPGGDPTTQSHVGDHPITPRSSADHHPIISRSSGDDRELAAANTAGTGALPSGGGGTTREEKDEHATTGAATGDPSEATLALSESEHKAAKALQGKPSRGRPPAWNWDGVAGVKGVVTQSVVTLLKRKKAGESPYKSNKTFKDEVSFKRFIQKQVQRVDGSGRGTGPNMRTVEDAIAKYDLKQYATVDE